jgi:hypothetical protein
MIPPPRDQSVTNNSTSLALPSIRKIGGYFAYHEASRWHPFRYSTTGRLLCPFDLNVAKMRFSISIFIQIVRSYQRQAGKGKNFSHASTRSDRARNMP